MKPEVKDDVAVVNQEAFDLVMNIWKELIKVHELENKEVARVQLGFF